MHKDNHGFTLVELLITVAVVTILGLATVINLSRSVANSNDASRLVQVRNFSQAVNLYGADNAGLYPIDESELEDELRGAYLTSFESDPLNKIEAGNILRYVYTVSKAADKYKISAMLQTSKFINSHAINSLDSGDEDQRYEIGNKPDLVIGDDTSVYDFYIDRNGATEF